MNTLFEVPNKQYILDNHKNIYIYCKGNVQEVRDYLEIVCGFDKAGWGTSRYTELNWLFVNSSNEVHGDYGNGAIGRKKCTINNLLDEYKLYNGCRPIKLKE